MIYHIVIQTILSRQAQGMGGLASDLWLVAGLLLAMNLSSSSDVILRIILA